MSNHTTEQAISRIERQLASKIMLSRISRGLTQTQLARMTGTKQEAISRLERHGCKTIEQFVRCMVAMGIEPVMPPLQFRELINKNKEKDMKLNIYGQKLCDVQHSALPVTNGIRQKCPNCGR